VQTVSGTSKTVTAYINGVPLYDVAATISNINPEFVTLGGTINSGKRLQVGATSMLAPDRWADPAFYERALTEQEIADLYRAGRSTLAQTQKKMMVVGSFDSLTAFNLAPFWRTAEEAALRPGCHFALDAIGGSAYNKGEASDYNNAARRGLRQRMLSQSAEHFDRVIWLCQYGTNDLVSGVMDPDLGTGWLAGRTQIDGMIAEDVLSVPSSVRAKVKRVLITIPAHGTLSASREIARLAYNDDCRTNWASRGYDALIDLASWVPPGFASLEAAAAHAVENAGNDIYQSDGIHWASIGGGLVADALHTPFIATQRAEVLS
jgi:hypothetical protein